MVEMIPTMIVSIETPGGQAIRFRKVLLRIE